MIAAVRAILREHRAFLILSLVYIVSGAVVQAWLDRPWTLRLITPWFAGVWAVASAVLLLVQRPRLTATRIGGASLIALLVVPLHLTFQSLKQSIGPVRGFPWDAALSRVDVWLHAGPAWHLLPPLLRDPLVLEFLDAVYFTWVPVVAVWFTWLSWLDDRPLRARALIATLGLWIGAGTVGAWLLASAGPCYYAPTGSLPPEPAYADLIQHLDRLRLMAVGAQQYVWSAYADDRWVIFGGISAMPSMHVAMTTMMAIVLSSRGSRSRTLPDARAFRRPISLHVTGSIAAIAWLYVVVIQIGSVALGWHYAIDGYVGAAMAWGCWTLAGPLARADVAGVTREVAPPTRVPVAAG